MLELNAAGIENVWRNPSCGGYHDDFVQVEVGDEQISLPVHGDSTRRTESCGAAGGAGEDGVHCGSIQSIDGINLAGGQVSYIDLVIEARNGDSLRLDQSQLGRRRVQRISYLRGR